MGKVMDEMSADLAEFIRAQPLFFVATAPLSAEGHVNLSPKGLDTFRILSPKRLAYLDMTGSGNETSAHLAENGRITLMFCSFDERPKIVRIYGKGQTVLPSDSTWPQLISGFEDRLGRRQLIVIDVKRIATSCGFGVPQMQFMHQRQMLDDWAQKKGEAGLETYRQEKNLRSIDGLTTPLGQTQNLGKP
jgi:hypothetical protein